MPTTHTMQKETATIVDRSLLDQVESKILSEITEMTKSLLHTFKFQMIYHARVLQQTEAKTVAAVKAYRKENKDSKNYLKELIHSK